MGSQGWPGMISMCQGQKSALGFAQCHGAGLLLTGWGSRAKHLASNCVSKTQKVFVVLAQQILAAVREFDPWLPQKEQSGNNQLL